MGGQEEPDPVEGSILSVPQQRTGTETLVQQPL